MNEFLSALEDNDELLQVMNQDLPTNSNNGVNIQDGDTINNQRLAGFDTPESLYSQKAQTIADEYGVPLDTQQQLGLKAKEKLHSLLGTNEYDLANQGIGAFGRDIVGNEQLTSDMISSGNAVPYDKYNEKTQNLYRNTMEKETNLFGSNREDIQAIRDYNLDKQEVSYGSRLGESVDALQSGAVQAVGKLGDFVTDVVSWGADKLGAENAAKKLDSMFETMASTEYADEVTGYDRREANFAMAEATHKWKMGDYVGALTEAITTPEVVAESLPLMLEMMVGGGKIKAVGKLGNYLSKNAGLASVIGQETNAQAEDFEKENGEKVSTMKLAEMTAMNTVMFSLDRLAFKDVLGLKDSLKATVTALPNSSKAQILKKVVTAASSTAIAGAKEGGQEYLQTWGEILNVSDTDMQGYVSQFSNEENQREALTGGIMGAGAGSQINLAGKAINQVKNTGKDVYQDAKTNINAEEEAIAPVDNVTPVNSKVIDLPKDASTSDYVTKIEELNKPDIDYADKQQAVLDLKPYIAEQVTKLQSMEAGEAKEQLRTELTSLVQKSAELQRVDTDIQTKAVEGDTKSKDRVFGSLNTGFSISTETVDSLLANDQITADEKAQLTNYKNRKAIRAEQIKSMGEVSNEVLFGISSQYMGMDNLLGNVTEAIKSKDFNTAQNQSTQLQNFITQRKEKADEVIKLYNQALDDGKTHKTQYLSQGVHKNSNKYGLIDKLVFEAKYAVQMQKELDRLMRAVHGDTTTETNTTTSEQPASELANDSGVVEEVVIDESIPEKQNFNGFDTTKTHEEKDVRPLITDMLQNPSKYPSSPKRQEFIGNNLEVLKVVAKELREKTKPNKPLNNGSIIDANRDNEYLQTTDGDIPTKLSTNKKPSEPQSTKSNESTDETISTPSEPSEEPKNTSRDYVQDTLDKIADLGETIDTYKEIVGELKTEKAALRNSIKRHSLDIDKVWKDIKAVEKRLKLVYAKKDEYKKQNKFIPHLLAKLNDLVKELRDTVNHFWKRHTKLLQLKDADKAELAQVQKDITQTYDIINNLKDKQKGLRKELYGTNANQKILDESISKGRAKYQDQVLDISKLYEAKGSGLLTGVDFRKYTGSLPKEVKQLMKEAGSFVDLIANMKKSKEKYWLKDSPGRALFYDKKGEIHYNTMLSIIKASEDYIAHQGSKLKFNSKEDVAKMLGYADERQLPATAFGRLVKQGKPKKLIAQKIGKQIIRELGYRGTELLDRELEAKIASDIGQFALIYMQSKGYIENITDTKYNMKIEEFNALRANPGTIDQNKKKATVGFIKLKDGVIDDDTQREQRKSTSDTLNEFFDSSITSKKGPNFRVRTEDREVKTRKNDIYETPTEMQSTVNKLEKEEYTLDHTSLETLKEIGVDKLKTLMGYKSQEDIDKLEFSKKDPAEARNSEIDESIEYLLGLEEDVEQKGNNLFFDWFFSKNGRFFMDTNTVNPQTDKLHRFLVTPVKHRVILDKSNKQDMTAFKLGIAQAFGFAIDKSNQKEALKVADNVLVSDIKDIMKLFEEGEHTLNNGQEIEIEEIGHAIQAIEAVKQFQANDEKFSTNLTLEIDAVTSGFILKLLQLPIIKDTLGWLQKGGIFTGNYGRYDQIEGTNGELDTSVDDAIVDAYKTMAIDTRVEMDPKNDKLGLWEAFQYTLPKITETVDGVVTVTKEGRDLFKYPFMTFNYGASINAIKRSLGYNMVSDLAQKMLDGDTEAMVLANKINALVLDPSMKITPKGLKEGINNKPALSVIKLQNKMTAEDYLVKLVKDSYGKGIEDIFKEKFQPMIDANSTINDSFKYMFRMFEVMYNDKVAQAKADGTPVTNEYRTNIVKELKDVFPAIRPFFGDVDSQMPIVKDKDLTILDPKTGAAQTHVQNMGQASINIQAMLKEFEEALSSGAVNSIHGLDGSIMNEVLRLGGVLGVHDAILPSLKDLFKTNEVYNEATYNMSKVYNLPAEVNTSLTRAVKAFAKAGYTLNQVKAVTRKEPGSEYKAPEVKIPIKQIFNELKDLNTVVKNNKRKIFKGKMKIDHATGANAVVEKLGTETVGNLEVYGSEPDTNSEAEQDLIEALELDSTQLDYKLGSNGRTINEETFKTMFESEVNSDNVLNVFDELQAYENTEVKPEHQEHFRDILSSLVQRAIKPSETILTKLEQQKERNAGVQVGDTVYISSQVGKPKTAVNQSVQEIYTHEMLHAVLKAGIEGGDSLAQAEVYRLFNHVKKVTEKQAKAKGSNPEDIFLQKDAGGKVVFILDEKSERAAAKEMYDYIFNNRDIQTLSNGKKVNNTFHEFVVYGLSNPSFIEHLKSLEDSFERRTKTKKRDSVFMVLIDWFTDYIENAFHKLEGARGNNAYEVLFNLSATLSGINERKTHKFRQLNVVNNLMNQYNTKFKDVLANAGQKAATYAKATSKDRNTRAGRLLQGLINIPKIAMNETMQEEVRKLVRKWKVKEDSFLGSIWNDLRGNTEKFAKWYELHGKSKHVIDQMRKQIADTIQKQLNTGTEKNPGGEFKTELDEIDKASITSGMLDTDIVSIFEDYTPTHLAEILESKTKLSAEIRAVETKIDKLPNAYYYKSRAEGLGHYMVFNTNKYVNQPLDAYKIANMWGTNIEPIGDVKKAEQLIDKLATLQALKYTTVDTKNKVASIIKREFAEDKDNNGIVFTMALAKNFKEQAQDKLFRGNKALMVKGYTKEMYDNSTFLQPAPLADREAMESRGFSFVRNLPKDNLDLVTNKGIRKDLDEVQPMALYVSTDGMVTPYMKQTVSITDKKSMGTSIKQIYRNSELGGKFWINRKIAGMKKINERAISQEVSGKAYFTDSNARYTLPIFNEKGKIVDYRYTMSKHTKVSMLNREQNFDVILGSMYGSLQDKVESRNINTEVVDNLIGDFKNDYDKDPKAFVAVSPESKKYAEIYAVLPDEMKYDAKTKFAKAGSPKGTIYVKRAVADLVFGYRKFTIAKVKFFEDKAKLQHLIKKIENNWQWIASVAKGNIIMRTPDVFLDNAISNFISAMYRGMSPAYAIKEKSKIIANIVRYRKAQEKYNMLVNRREAGLSTDAAEIARLHTTMQNNMVHTYMEKGVYQAIVEDLSAETTKPTSTQGKAVARVAKERLNKRARKIAEEAYMVPGTATYEATVEGTRIDDAASKILLTEWLMKSKKLPFSEAFNLGSEAYINYDGPLAKGLQYLDDIMFFPFSKYFLRIQRVILRTLVDHPIHSAIGMLLQSMLGDIADPIDSSIVTTDVVGKANNLVELALLPVDVLTPSIPEIVYKDILN